MTATLPSYNELYLQVAGERIGAGMRATRPVLNPATGAILAELPIATDDDLARALAAAARGFEHWRATSAYDRAKVLHRTAELMRERVDSIARTMTLEQGKVLAEARLEVLAAADIFDWNAEEGRRAYGRVVPARSPAVRQIVMQDPVGVVVAFTPWNFPALTPARKLSGALAAGCSIIIKPAEETPGTALALMQALLDAGLPENAAQMLFGDPAHISSTLILSPIVRKVSFTGSTAVGKQLAALAAQGVKRATLELGGHAPVVVTERADLNRAVTASVAAKFRNAGQVCVSPSRFIVQESIYDQFAERFIRAAADLRVAPGLEEGAQMGSLANERRRSSIHGMVQDALARGATVQLGGAPLEQPGFFYPPTVLTDIPADARVLNEEPFGPVAAITTFREIPQAIAEANRLPYGLAAYVFTQDVSEHIALTGGIESGMIGVNHFGVSLAEIPFGGVKESGYGSEGGTEGIESYLVTKSVTTM
ncbi:MAG TPA: NAD-dependent succinate-semialdehyde dehydrogenase [Candidatus Baltobacteraceae bacterium]|nr:NAD-dependent succinate-semialdehyde dehydrogenase [Candidatus Baltobacteraceae bacterium]